MDMRIEKGKKGYKIIPGYNEWFSKYVAKAAYLLRRFLDEFRIDREIALKIRLNMEKEMKEKKVKWEDIPSFVSMILLREFLGDKRIEKMRRYIMKEFKPNKERMFFYQETAEQWVASWETFVNGCVKGHYLEPEEYANDLSVRIIIQENYDRFSPELKKRIEKADKKFRKIFVTTNEPLSKKLGERYSREEYWWLYGDPKNAPWYKRRSK